MRRWQWLGMLLIVLMGWMSVTAAGVTLSPGTADRRLAVTRAVAWLHTQQRSDGAFGSADESVPGSLTLTADAVYSVALAGEDPNGAAWSQDSHSLLDALRTLSATQATNAGRIGKALRALGVSGLITTDPTVATLVAKLQAFYDPATGLYHPSQGFFHVLAIEGLARVKAPVPSAAIQAVLSRQKADGGWGWQFGLPESPSDVDTTGQVMRALRAAGIPPDHLAMIRAVTFLASQQRADGGWGWGEAATSSDGNATGMALAGLLAAGANPLAPPFASQEPTALTFILNLQQPSGAFAYLPTNPEDNLLATLDVIPALSRRWPGDPGVFFPDVRRN